MPGTKEINNPNCCTLAAKRKNSKGKMEKPVTEKRVALPTSVLLRDKTIFF